MNLVLQSCISCGATAELVKCTHDDCSNLLCPAHSGRHGGRCRCCWDSGSILLPRWPLGAPRPDRAWR